MRDPQTGRPVKMTRKRAKELRGQIRDLTVLITEYLPAKYLEIARNMIAVPLDMATDLDVPLPEWFLADPEMTTMFAKNLQRLAKVQNQRLGKSDRKFLRQIGISPK